VLRQQRSKEQQRNREHARATTIAKNRRRQPARCLLLLLPVPDRLAPSPQQSVAGTACDVRLR
jgi:hypothetical protein